MKHKIAIILISIVFNYVHTQELTLEMKPIINYL